MILSPASDTGAPSTGPSLMLIEGGLTLIAVVLAFCWPRLGSTCFSRIERVFGRLARRQGLAVGVVGFAALLLRLAILPLNPIPHPFIQDDFSFLLAADTFASGRLTNPTPAMWTHFESFHITMKPTYMSMYFPAHGLLLAAGKVLTGNPWYGLLCVTVLMCAAICWMLQAWLPPTWALLGGMLAVLRLGLFSYWINTYTGGASLAALGGALVLGAFPRLMKSARLRDAVLLGLGAAVLALSRPYEGILLCLPVAFVLGRWMLSDKNRPRPAVLLRLTAAPLLLIASAGSWLAYYDYRVFGNPLTLPYKVNRATYSMVPYFVWQQQRPEPAYRHPEMRRFYYKEELVPFQKLHSVSGFLVTTLFKGVIWLMFFAGITLLPPLTMIRPVLTDRRMRFMVVCGLVLTAGMTIEIFVIPHYLAPFTSVFYALGLQAMRHLRVWSQGGRPVGLAMVRLIVTGCVTLAIVRAWAEPLHLSLSEWPSSSWYGSGDLGATRAGVEAELEHLPGNQLAIVRYSGKGDPRVEWVYNAADIDRSRVIWARDMGDADNQELLRFYKDRKAWLIQPDTDPVRVTPITLSGQNGPVPPMSRLISPANSGNAFDRPGSAGESSLTPRESTRR